MDSTKKDNCIGELPLSSVRPDWGSHSNLINTIIELERLRVRVLGGSTPPHIFFELKSIFHKLESLGSSRIEGNRTTLADYVRKITEMEEGGHIDKDEHLREVLNIEEAMRFIEDAVSTDTHITKGHLFELHKIVTEGLSSASKKHGGEGSNSPGSFRMVPVSIKGSNFCPPDYTQVNDYIEDLLRFVNDTVETKEQLLRVAIAHHRFACIHPFDNGNGRVVRLFTYMLLLRYGFQVRDEGVGGEQDSERIGRILNPTAIFCIDRNRYYDILDQADSGKKEDLLEWCEYVLGGLLEEIKKIDKLLDYAYLRKTILLPAVDDAREYGLINDTDHKILSYVFIEGVEEIKASTIRHILNTDDPVKVSRITRFLKERGILTPIEENGRIYEVSLTSKHLIRSVINMLEKNGFAPGLSE